jgi:mannitol-1-phosphate 5-dehydrogenase
VEGPSLVQPIPNIKGWHVVDALKKYNERKLFTLNTGHAIAAYLGVLKGKKTIDEAIEDKEIRDVVYGALQESGQALVKKHGFMQRQHLFYINKMMMRYKVCTPCPSLLLAIVQSTLFPQNPNVKDDVSRVGRQPLRKLGKQDRLVGPMVMCKEFGFETTNLPIGIAAALLYDDSSDEQSKELQQTINDKGLENAVAEITGFEKGSEEHRRIVEAYNRLKKE